MPWDLRNWSTTLGNTAPSGVQKGFSSRTTLDSFEMGVLAFLVTPVTDRKSAWDGAERVRTNLEWTCNLKTVTKPKWSDGVGEPALGSGPGMVGKMVGRWCMITWGGGRAAGGRARRPHHVDTNERASVTGLEKRVVLGELALLRVGSWSGHRTPWSWCRGGWCRCLCWHTTAVAYCMQPPRFPNCYSTATISTWHVQYPTYSTFDLQLVTKDLHEHCTIIRDRIPMYFSPPQSSREIIDSQRSTFSLFLMSAPEFNLVSTLWIWIGGNWTVLHSVVSAVVKHLLLEI